MELIYLDNAATTMKKPDCVVEAVAKALTTMGNAARGAHQEALEASRVDYQTRIELAQLLGCSKPDHVIFTANSTEALNIALFGLFQKGDHVISTDLEHNSVLRPLYQLEAEGIIQLSFVAADSKGRVFPEDFEKLFQPNTKAIVTTHASNLTGNCVDIAALGQLAHSRKAYLVVDASQTAGTIPIHMEEMGIDVLCATGHKGLMGPQGTGCLCLREEIEIRPLLVGGTGVQSHLKTQPLEYPTRLEAGTLNSHGLAGLLAAVRYIQEVGVNRIHAHEISLMRQFLSGIESLPGLQVYGDFSSDHRAAIVALNLEDWDSSLLADELSVRYNIATRAGAHCAPRMHHALGTDQQGAVRFSFSWFNTQAEVEQAILALRELAHE